MPSTWHGVSSLLPVSERFAYRKIPERTKTAGRKSRRGSLGTETIYGEKSGNRRVVDRIRGNAQSHHSRAGIRVAAFVQTSRIRYRRREQPRTGSREHESGELATDFKRPGPDRCDHEGRVKVGGRSSATPRSEGSQQLAPPIVVRFRDSLFGLGGRRLADEISQKGWQPALPGQKKTAFSPLPVNCHCAPRAFGNTLRHASLHRC